MSDIKIAIIILFLRETAKCVERKKKRSTKQYLSSGKKKKLYKTKIFLWRLQFKCINMSYYFLHLSNEIISWWYRLLLSFQFYQIFAHTVTDWIYLMISMNLKYNRLWGFSPVFHQHPITITKYQKVQTFLFWGMNDLQYRSLTEEVVITFSNPIKSFKNT